MKLVRKLLNIIYLYLGLIGIFGFAAFIHEESIQMLTFSLFTIKDTQRWDIAYRNLNTMRSINHNLKWLVDYTLWLNPFQQEAYNDFVVATDGYIDAQEAMVIAQDPGLYEGRTITIDFYYKSINQTELGIILRAGKIFVIVKSLPAKNPVQITGIINKLKDSYFIKQES